MVAAASRAVLPFQKVDVAFAVRSFKKLAVDAVFAVLETAAFGEDAVDVLLRIAAP